MIKRFLITFLGSMAAIWFSAIIVGLLFIAGIATAIVGSLSTDKGVASVKKLTVLTFDLSGEINDRKATPTFDDVISGNLSDRSSLADITMYTDHGDEPLPQILEAIKEYTKGEPIDLKAFANEQALRDYFGEIISDYDRERVYTTDIRKLFSWYNLLIGAGITEFKNEEIVQDEAAEAAEAADEAQTTDK